MRKFQLTILFVAFSLCSAIAGQKSITYNEKLGIAADKIWPGTERLWLKQDNILPAFIQFRDGSEPNETKFFITMRKLYQLPGNYGFQLIHGEKDQIGWEHKRYQLTVNNIPVREGIFIVHLVNGKVKKFNGELFKKITASLTATLSEQDALNKALADIAANVYQWQMAGADENLKQKTGDASATYYPKGVPEIVQVGGLESNTFRLAWKFDVYAVKPLSRNYIYVDAQNGEILKKISRICNANSNGTAVTAYRGPRAIVADSYNGVYRLNETDRGQGIHTYNLQTGTNYGAAVEFIDSDNYWNNVNAQEDQYAGDAHWGGEMTYDFYQDAFGRNSIDNNGFGLVLYVHYDVQYLNAFWDGQEMNFGDGSTGYTPLTSLDITGHEISHGLDQFTANLDYMDESGALNESFSDIFGTAVEWFADSTTGNWLIGEDIGTPFRDMQTPKNYQQPDTYLGQYWYTGTADNGGVHTNSGVQNHWDYILAEGDTGTNDNGDNFSVLGITRHEATQVAWRDEVYYLTNTSQYADTRYYSIQAATDLFGACSQQVISTTNAWYAVGVGDSFSFGVTAQFSASPDSGCNVPLDVTFSNTSVNGGSYIWTFGDGGTSTAISPVHTYNTLGTYTVKLFVDGGSCGVDSLTIPNYINISTSNPCVVILTDSGASQTQTSCTGTIYDNGGPNANYSDMTDSWVTISPTGAAQVNLHFTAFDMENTYDFVNIYDGPSTASPQIGHYTGATIPADITSSGSSVTIEQTSDQALNYLGFAVQWTCIQPTSPPVAGFTSDVTQTCSGSVFFTDTTTGGAISWLWTFGDGDSSTLENPQHTYAANGSYTVTLIATNNIGSNTATRVGYITVNMPAAPVAPSQTGCASGVFTIAANTVNPVSWTDTAGSFVSNANPFTTPVISSNTTYYVRDSVPGNIGEVGPTDDNAIGGGGYYSNSTDRYLTFDVLSPCNLLSVVAYAQAAGVRVFALRNSAGTTIQSLSVNLNAGANTVNLNFSLTPGTNYELAINGASNLYRNNAGAPAYPYILANRVSITGSDAGAGFYYYFYDWQIEDPACISLPTAVNITISGGFSASINSTPPNCNASNDGSATVAVTGGVTPFTYNWGGGQTGATITGLGAGTYSVTVTDSTGCTGSATQVIVAPAALAATVNALPTTCGVNNGSASAVVTGGTTQYGYSWTGGGTGANISNVAAGNYTVTVTDANNCTATAIGTVSSSTALGLTTAPIDASCFGSSNGSASVTVTGSTGLVTYLWNTGGITATINGIVAGTYTVTVNDAAGCTATTSETVSEPTELDVTVTSTGTGCGTSTGTATANATGGTIGYSYNWSTGGNSATVSNLSGGTYQVTVTDANTCTVSADVVVSSTGGLSLVPAETDANCFGDSTGSASISVNGGVNPITYIWSNGSASSSINNVPAGTYTVSVTDSAGCYATASQIISQPAQLIVNITATNASCGNTSDGSALANPAGGSSGYGYVWNDAETTPSISNLAAGNYGVTVTDAHTCTASATVSISNSGSLVLNPSSTDANCFGSIDGSASVVETGGAGNVSYSWSNGSNASSISGVSAGTYTVTATDSVGCTATETFNILQPNALSITSSSTDASCGLPSGTAGTVVTGGTPGYAYLWSNGGTTAIIQALAAGTYLITVTDNHSCTSTSSVVVNGSLALVTNAAGFATSCNAGADGGALVNVTSGNSPYLYTWSMGATTPSVTGLTAGTYYVTVSDSANCLSTDTVVVTQPTAVAITVNTTETTCSYTSDGSATASVTGGTAGYTYNWSGGENGASVGNLASGSYTITVTDAHSCTGTATLAISSPSAVAGAITSTNELCNAGETGSAQVVANGGIAPYTYLWNNGATGSSITGVPAGTYAVTITDNHNCTVIENTDVTEPTAIQSTTSETDASGGQNNGSATVGTASGGTGPYTYLWSNDSTTQSIINIAPGTYYVTITDQNGCNEIDTVVVNNITGIIALSNNFSFNIFPNPANTQLTVQMAGLNTEVTISIKNVLGQILMQHSTSATQYQFDVTTLAADVYFIEISGQNKLYTRPFVVVK